MARVLAYTSPARGHLFPVTPILDELLGRGHEVALRTLASQVELMRARGFDAAPIDPAIERVAHDDYDARTPLGAQKRAMHVFCRRAEFDAADLRRAIEGAADLFLAAPLLLYLTAEPFEYPRSDWPEAVRLVGPCDWDPPADPRPGSRMWR
jgi:hypothetical protein